MGQDPFTEMDNFGGCLAHGKALGVSAAVRGIIQFSITARRCVLLSTICLLLGRLLQVDLIKWVSNVRQYVRPQ